MTENGGVNASLAVRSDAERTLDTSLAVRPGSPSTLVRPTARLSLSNQWREPLTRDVRLTGPGTALDREVTVGPGESARLSADLARRAPGSYPVRVTFAGGSRELNTTYRVTGDDRIVAALATSGRTGSSGIGQAIEVAFGNLGLLVATLVVLAALMTVGGTTAAFAAAVAARRRTLGIYRATGATPARVARLVLADALRVGLVAAVVAVVLASVTLLGLGAADLLVVFGVRLGFPSLPVLAACAVGAVLLTLVAAGLALVEPLRVPPRSLLDDETSSPKGSERSEARRQRTKSATPARGDDDD
jgi:hypothetical protein